MDVLQQTEGVESKMERLIKVIIDKELRKKGV